MMRSVPKIPAVQKTSKAEVPEDFRSGLIYPGWYTARIISAEPKVGRMSGRGYIGLKAIIEDPDGPENGKLIWFANNVMAYMRKNDRSVVWRYEWLPKSIEECERFQPRLARLQVRTRRFENTDYNEVRLAEPL